MSRIVYVNGQYVAGEDAKISIFDRAVLFADSVYEVTAVLGGRLIDYDHHQERLSRSLKAIYLDWPCPENEMRTMHEKLIAHNQLDQGWIYLQISRGSADRDFKFPKNSTPHLLAFTQAKNLLAMEEISTGVACITLPDQRWARRDIKSTMLLASVLGKQAAYEAGAFEAWLVEDGKVTEGTASNAYIIKDNKIITQPLSQAILPGCTRRALLHLAQKHEMLIEERGFSPAEAYDADEAFLTSASNFVLGIVKIDQHVIGSGRPGALTMKLRELYIKEALDSPSRSPDRSQST